MADVGKVDSIEEATVVGTSLDEIQVQALTLQDSITVGNPGRYEHAGRALDHLALMADLDLRRQTGQALLQGHEVRLMVDDGGFPVGGECDSWRA